MAKLAEMLQYFGIFFLISGAAPLSIAVFGSFLVDPSPIALQTFWGEAVCRAQDLYMYQQTLAYRYDPTGCELKDAGEHQLEVFMKTVRSDRTLGDQLHCGQRAFRARLLTDPTFALEMYHQYHGGRGSGVHVKEYLTVDPTPYRAEKLLAEMKQQKRDQVFFEIYDERTRHRRHQLVFGGLAVITVGLGLCVGGWYLR